MSFIKFANMGLAKLRYGTHISLNDDPFAVSPIDDDVMVYALSA